MWSGDWSLTRALRPKGHHHLSIFHSLGDYAKAKEYLEKHTYDRIGGSWQSRGSNTLRKLRKINVFLGDYVKAKEYLKKTLVITLEIRDRAGEATHYGNVRKLMFQSLGDNVRANEDISRKYFPIDASVFGISLRSIRFAAVLD